jgi:hypothetical protein
MFKQRVVIFALLLFFNFCPNFAFAASTTAPSISTIDAIQSFFSDASAPKNLLKIRQFWGFENMLRMYDRYEEEFKKGNYISSYSSVLEDSFVIAGVAYDFLGISCSFCVGLSALYWGYYLAPGWFYRAANYNYAALDGKQAFLPFEEFHFDANSDYSRSAYLKCEYFTSEEDIKNGHRPTYSNYVMKKDIPEKLQSEFHFSKGRWDTSDYVVVPGRWLRLGAKNSGGNQAAFGTVSPAVALDLACAFGGKEQNYPNLEKLKPVITVENNSWVGSYPVFFYVEGRVKDEKDKSKDRIVAAKLIPDLSYEEPASKKDCHCSCEK